MPNSKDAIHKAWLYRLLTGIYDNQILANSLYFKGGTCAAMLGFLDRFSIDLDFDYVGKNKDIVEIRKELEKVFKKLGLSIKDKSKNIPQYFLRYSANEGERNTIKVDITLPPPKSNIYKAVRLSDIDRVATCQTIETMFANKLVALIDRYERNGSIAGRDLYDIHHFFIKGFGYNEDVIVERTGQDLVSFFEGLSNFIDEKITQTIINQDLNYLLPPDDFQKIRGVLKKETLMFIKDEIKRVEKATVII